MIGHGGSATPTGDTGPSGPERIAAAFARAHDQGRGALTAFLAAGDPDYETTVALAHAAVDAGADVIELGSPFSDPLADGPVIQAAYTRALANGANTNETLACARRIAEETGAPVVVMAAFNTVLAIGVRRYCQQAAAAGVSGLLVPDLPVEEADELRSEANAARLGTVFLVGPDSSGERVAAAATAASGFVYVLRRRGITGAGPGGDGSSARAAAELRQRVAQARAASSVPVAIGFGITTPADAAEVAAIADGIIVGSALVDAAFEASAGSAGSAASAVVGERVRDLARALEIRPPSLDEPSRAAAGTGDTA